MELYDLVIVGGGPGGYVAALRATNRGFKTALIEGRELGGTCLNRGCIPSKTFLKNASIIDNAKSSKYRGINISDIEIDLQNMVNHKNRVLKQLRSGIDYLLKKGEIDFYNAYANVEENKEITLSTGETITAKNIIIATGSTPFVPPLNGIENISYETTDTVFDLDEVPKSMSIIGGGIIGVECADIFSSLGTKVTIIEQGERLIPSEDKDASDAIQDYLSAKNIEILTNVQINSVNFEENVNHINLTIGSKDIKKSIDKILIATGRKPNIKAIEQLDIKRKGSSIKVNEYMETSIPGIYAIGDVIGGWQLAHAASAEGLIAVNNLHDAQQKIDYDVMPRCVYTSLEVASIGESEKSLVEKSVIYQTKKLPLENNGKSKTLGNDKGFVKVMYEKETGEILGVVMVGPNVTEIISQASAFMFLEGTVEEMAAMVQPHPSLSEIMTEVANAALGKPIHA